MNDNRYQFEKIKIICVGDKERKVADFIIMKRNFPRESQQTKEWK